MNTKKASLAALLALVLMVGAALPVAAQEAGRADAEAPVADANGEPGADDSAEAREGRPESEQQGRAGTLQISGLQVEDRSVFGGFRAYGDILVSYQTSSVDGSEDRFRKDFGLNDGVRIKNSSVTFVPHGDDAAGWFDRIQIYGDNIGGDDKYQTWGVRASKAGRYSLNVRDRRLNWFWNVTGEPHSWAPTRHMTDADLSVNLTRDLVIKGHFNRFSQSGSGVTTRDFSREEFFLDEPYDQVGTNWGIGLRWRLGRTVIFADQSFRKFNNDLALDFEGFDDGSAPGGTTLETLNQLELREMTAPVTRAGINTSVADGRVRISGDILYSKQDMDFGFDRRWTGTNSSGNSTTVNQASSGGADREILHGNVRVGWSASARVNVYAQYRRRGWDQDGGNEFANGGLRFDTLSTYKVTLDQIFGGAEWAVTRGVSLFGRRTASRVPSSTTSTPTRSRRSGSSPSRTSSAAIASTTPRRRSSRRPPRRCSTRVCSSHSISSARGVRPT